LTEFKIQLEYPFHHEDNKYKHNWIEYWPNVVLSVRIELILVCCKTRTISN
jgi:hypothetical protein